MANYKSLVVNGESCFAEVWNSSAMEFVLKGQVRVHHTAERDVPGFQCYDQRMGQSCFGILVSHASGVGRCFNHCGFTSSILRCNFDSNVVYLAYPRSS